MNNNERIHLLTDATRKGNIDHVVHEFTCFFKQNALNIFEKTHRIRKCKSRNNWYSTECYNVKLAYKRERNSFYREKSDESWKRFTNARTFHNKTKKKKEQK